MVNAWRKQHIRDQRSSKRQDACGKTGHDCPLKTSDGLRQTSSGECSVFDDLFDCRGSPESFRGCNSVIHARDTRAATVIHAGGTPAATSTGLLPQRIFEICAWKSLRLVCWAPGWRKK